MARQGECRPDCGACCEFVILPIDSRVATELEPYLDWVKWLALHGMEAKLDGRGLRVRVPLKCMMLTRESKCQIYDHDEGPHLGRPKMCANAPTCPEDLEGIEGCSYTFEDELLGPGQWME